MLLLCVCGEILLQKAHCLKAQFKLLTIVTETCGVFVLSYLTVLFEFLITMVLARSPQALIDNAPDASCLGDLPCHSLCLRGQVLSLPDTLSTFRLRSALGFMVYIFISIHLA